MTPQEKLYAYAKERIASWEKTLAADFTWVPDFEAEFGIEDVKYSGGNNYADAEFPFDRKLMERITAYLSANGWMLEWERPEEKCKTDWYSDPAQTWKKDGHSLVVTFNDLKRGSVCRRREIGKVTVKQPIYEYACQEMTA